MLAKLKAFFGHPLVTAIVGALVGVGGAVAVVLIQHQQTVDDNNQKQQKASVSISRPAQNELIQRCVGRVEGTANVPPGQTLWVAEHGLGDEGFYSLTKVTVEDNKWHASLSVGSEKLPSNVADKTFSIDAFIISKDESDVLDNIGEGPAINSFFFLRKLPNPSSTATVAVVRRGSDPNLCK